MSVDIVEGGLKKLQEKHRMIAMLTVVGLGNKEIAERMGMTAGRISQLKGMPLFQAYCERLRREGEEEVLDLRQRIREAAPAALECLIELLDHAESGAVQLGAAKDILDRAGYSPVKKVANLDISTIMTKEEFESTRNLFDAAKAAGAVLDVTPKQ